MFAMQRLPILIAFVSFLTVLFATPVIVHHHLQRQNANDTANSTDTDMSADSADIGPPIVDIPSPIQHTGDIKACQGYKLTAAKVLDDETGVDGTLELIGNCSAYGPDYSTLKLTVRYETENRLRVRIVDQENKAHVVPSDVAKWPEADKAGVDNSTSKLAFEWDKNPFAFRVKRKSDGTVLFDTTGQAIIFEQQYLRVQSKLREGSNIQGLGQHNDNFTLPISRDHYTRTLWTRDAYGVPTYTNLYGAHPIYVNQKVGDEPEAHGVYLLNSNGMDIRFPNGQAIEYSTLGGVIDLFFLNGPTPADVAAQATEIWGKPAEFHSCKYGYIDIAEVAEVVANYSAAGIPVQTQWMDIDYMYARWIQTLDPSRFALDKVQYVVQQLQANNQDFIVMVDPAVFSGTPNSSVSEYGTYQRGVQEDVFMKLPKNGELYQGVVWPGPTVFPDWTAENAQDWWTDEFRRFFDPSTGFDVSGIWLDMNEPANFLPYLEANIYRVSQERPVPPPRPLPRTIPRSIAGFERFEAGTNISASWNGSTQTKRSLPPPTKLESRQNRPDNATDADYVDPELDNQWLYPPYRLQDRRQAPSTSGNSASGSGLKNISDFSARTDIVQANGARTYDEHNLYGSRHAIVTRNALLARRPEQKPFTIARSSFSGTPSGLWLGDNISSWEQYIQTIRQMLQFGAVAGVGMVGADSCGFGGNTTETLCARWAWLGALSPFYRNHNELGNIPQEFYRWNLTTIAARAAGKTRLRLLDYAYTFLHKQHVDGTPALWPLSWVHPTEAGTVSIEHQYYFGPSLLVSPVVAENSTSVDIYIPNGTFYDFFTLKRVDGRGTNVTINDVGYDTMPLHVRGGSIIPLRTGEANTTTDNRALPFDIVIAPNATKQAEGYLRLDDGISLDVGDKYADVYLTFDGDKLDITGKFGYAAKVDAVVFAGQTGQKQVQLDGQSWSDTTYDEEKQTITAYGLNRDLGGWSVSLV